MNTYALKTVLFGNSQAIGPTRNSHQRHQRVGSMEPDGEDTGV